MMAETERQKSLLLQLYRNKKNNENVKLTIFLHFAYLVETFHNC